MLRHCRKITAVVVAFSCLAVWLLLGTGNLRAVKLRAASCELRVRVRVRDNSQLAARNSQLAARNSQLATSNFTARKLTKLVIIVPALKFYPNLAKFFKRIHHY